MVTTLRCSNSVYLHLPKTAGNAVSRLLHKNGLVMYGFKTPRMKGKPGHGIDPHANVAQIYQQDQVLPRWTVFRHPVSWFESYWSYKKQIEWVRGATQKKPLNFIDDRVVKDSIDETVKKCYADKSTVVEDVFEEYRDDKTIIALQENLYEYIVQIIDKLESAKLDKQYWKVANSTNKKYTMNEESANLIWAHESHFFSTFYNCDRSISEPWKNGFVKHLHDRS